MRVFLSSTPKELERHQAVAGDVARELGMELLRRDPGGLPGFRGVPACVHQVAAADLVVAVVGHRRGLVPPPADGGDGFHPWSWWETRAAFERGLGVVVLMASEAWRPELVEDDANARAVMLDFRGELRRLAVLFDDDADDGFRELVRRELLGREQAAPDDGPDVRLRRWPPPSLPPRPYPVLLHYTHPDLLAGRDRELDRLRRLLARPLPILGLHAPSGTGKTSLLLGGLVPTLRAEGRPAALDRHPWEPGLAGRLLGDLLDDGGPQVDDGDPDAFADRLRDVVLGGAAPPVLVLDQFEDLLRPEADRARAVVGRLLAASAQRLPGLAGPPCRWLLAYRQEFHGEIFQWLGDVLRHADGGRAAGALPHDLSSPDRFHAWPLSPLGTPAPGTVDRAAAAARVFEAAIEKPLGLTSPEGGQVYPWRFAADGARRLARAFGEARTARSDAPLTPELQVVLAHLLEGSSQVEDGVRVVEVPDDPGDLIDQALEEHLRRALDDAFPAGRKAAARIGRTRALLALRELADVHGRRDEGRPVDALARAVGHDGRDVLEKLATAKTRIVLLEEHDGEQVYVLSHDRMAEVVTRLVDEEEGAYAGLGVDGELLGLRRFVALQRQLFEAGEVEQATEVPKDHFLGVESHADALLWDDEGRRWWTACRERQSRDRRRKAIRRGLAAVAVAVLGVVVWIWAGRASERRELYRTIRTGEAEVAFQVLAGLDADVDVQEVLEKVAAREKPFDVLERGLGGVDEERRGRAVLRVAELLLPLVGEDPVLIASAVWALDFFAAPEPTLRDKAIALRNEVLEPLRQKHPPPPLPEPDDPDWADVPAGTFQMGGNHPVQVSAFRMLVHEVTNAEYRRLFPPFVEGEDDLPTVGMDWYEAYTYSAWLGGRLPTEAEWEYAARAGCSFTWCGRDGSEATADEVAWWVGHSAMEEPSVKPVMQLEPNLWGIYDVFGNVSERTANWAYYYPAEPEVDPTGPTSDPARDYRIQRGGNAWDPQDRITRTSRGVSRPESRFSSNGFRVVLPDPGVR